MEAFQQVGLVQVLSISHFYQDGIVILITELCQFFIWRSCYNAVESKKSTKNHYHRQVARLLQIQSVEKICKKFVTHKINLDNCLGKSIHNYQKNKILVAGRFCLADSFIGWTDASKSLFTFIEVNIARCDDKDKFAD